MAFTSIANGREAVAASANGQLFRPTGKAKAADVLKLISSSALKKRKKLQIKENLSEAHRERLTFFPQLLEADVSYDPQTRTAQVIIIEVGRGNSRDRHYYGEDTIRQAAADKVFEGAQAYADHPSIDEDINRPERSVRDLFGYYFNTRVTEVTHEDGSRVPALAASLKIQSGADWAIGLIQEAIDYNKRFPDKTYVGISINADGDVAPATIDNEQVNYVHRITEAFSADMVTKPARGGKFLALIESEANTKEDAMDKKLIESAARLKSQIDSGQIDKDELTAHLSLIEAESKSQKATDDPANDNDEDDLKESQAFMEAMSDDEKKSFAKLDEAKKPLWLAKKMAEKMTERAKEARVGSGEDTTQGDGTADNQPHGKKVAGSFIKESDVKVQHPAIFAAALKEAQSVVSGDVTALRSQVAEMTARQSMRESIDLAKQKLTESSLPAAAATVLLESLVGKPANEMDRLIEAQVDYLKMLNINIGKTPGNSDRSLQLRESDSKANSSFLFAGMGEY